MAAGQYRMSTLARTIFIVANVFGSWALTFPVVPLLVSTTGGSRFAAGSTTGVFMAATIVAQLATPMLLRRFDFRPVIVSGCLLLGLPTLALAPLSADITGLMAISVVRGIGFGLVTVACSALPAHLSTKDRLGRAVAAQGMANAGSQTAFLLIGMQLYRSCGVVAVSVLATAMAVTAAVAAACWLPSRMNGKDEPNSECESTQAVFWRPFALANVSVVGIAMAYGGLSTLVPLVDYPHSANAGVILAVIGASVVSGRFAAGRCAHRILESRPIAQMGVLAAVVGSICFFVGVVVSSAGLSIILVGAVAFGFGLGWIQNVTLVRLFTSVPPQRVGFASAAWNISMDAGIGLGSTAIGAAADHTGFGGAHLLSAVAVTLLVALPFAIKQSRGVQPEQVMSEERPSRL